MTQLRNISLAGKSAVFWLSAEGHESLRRQFTDGALEAFIWSTDDLGAWVYPSGNSESLMLLRWDYIATLFLNDQLGDRTPGFSKRDEVVS